VGKITLTLTPSGKGVHTKYATVYSNDPKLGEFQLTVKFEPFIPKGYRVGSYLFDPTNEVEATIAPGQGYEGKVGIYFNSDRLVKIKKTVNDNPAFTANIETVTPGREFKLLVKSANPLPAGAHKLLVELVTDDPNQETLEVVFLVKAGNASAVVASPTSAAPAKAVNKKSPTKSSAKTKRTKRDL